MVVKKSTPTSADPASPARAFTMSYSAPPVTPSLSKYSRSRLFNESEEDHRKQEGHLFNDLVVDEGEYHPLVHPPTGTYLEGLPDVSLEQVKRGTNDDISCLTPRPLWSLNRITGREHQHGCGRLRTCAPCARAACWRNARAIALAHPPRLLTFTLTGRDWDQIHQFTYKLRRRLPQELLEHWNVVWAAHQNQDGDSHLHAFQRGRRIPDDALQEAATKAGGGPIVHTRPITGWAFGYLTHPITDTAGLPDQVAMATVNQHLALNGDRAIHSTRGFWLTSSGVRTTLRRARAEANRPGDEWELTSSPPSRRP